MPPRDLKSSNMLLDSTARSRPAPERVVVIPARERPIGDAIDTAQRLGWPTPSGAWLE